MKKIPNIEQVKSYFDQRIQEHGASPKGADWNSDASQNVRFDQLLKVIEGEEPFSLLDYGCGYGALYDHLIIKGYRVEYYGYDILESAIAEAKKVHAGNTQCTFLTDKETLPLCDYAVASGTFNYRGNQSFEDWTEVVLNALAEMNSVSRKGFASNFLTKYSDADRMRPDLYYADPLMIFDYCKRNFSKNVALLHDYRVYDFTIIVRKDQ